MRIKTGIKTLCGKRKKVFAKGFYEIKREIKL